MSSNIRKLVALSLLAWLLAACASSRSSGYRYNEVVIVNQTRSAVTDVTVAATDSGRLFGCGNIAPRGICSNRFAPRDYSASPIEVTWSVAGVNRREIVEVTVPRGFVAQLPMRGVLVIDSRGGIDAYLQQDLPGPHL